MADQRARYSEWLEEQGYKVRQDRYAAHRNMLQHASPAAKALELFLRNHANSGSVESGASVFTPAEREIVWKALNLLQQVMVPISLLDVIEEEEDPIRKMLFKADASRVADQFLAATKKPTDG